MNLPNKLTVLRLFMVPLCILSILIPESWLPSWISSLIAGVIFIAASVTDMIDGKLARKYNLVTDFGKFMDPLADKFMVIGSMLAILYRYDNIRPWFFWCVLVVVFRELAVTAMRLVVSTGDGTVVAASKLGKIKTVTQIVCVCAVLFEPLFYPADSLPARLLPLTVLAAAACTLFTLISGIDYLRAYWKYLDWKK